MEGDLAVEEEGGLTKTQW